MTGKPTRKYIEKKNVCQFCSSTNYDMKAKTCRDCGTTAPENPPGLRQPGRTLIYLAPKAERYT